MPGQLLLLGLPQLKSAADRQALRLNNPVLLLIYLAVKGNWISRSELAFFFRPDDNESSALKQIRLLLYRAKKLAWAGSLEIDRARVRFEINTDIQVFEAAIHTRNWADACKIYTAPFLGNYGSPDLPTYNAWLELERSDLAASYKDALIKYSAALETQGSYDGAAEVIAKLVALDPFNEDNLQNYLRTLYLSGRRDKAIEIYDKFCHELAHEYDALPLEKTQTLADDIRHSKNIAPEGLKQETIKVLPRSNLPAQGTHFIGRKDELAILAQHLSDPKCRLLSIIGLGGIGKTRLAIALASSQQTLFLDGVVFLALVSLNSSENLISGLAQALGLTLAPQKAPLEEIKSYLKEKNLLLVLDNFEHLLKASPIITELLQSSPQLKIIVTSRERLNLQSEWLYDLEGLSYPALDSLDNLESFDAVQLFINSAKRVAPRLEMSQKDLEAILIICRQVEGIPLAIELAASWARIFPVDRIAKELDKGFDLLDTDNSDVAPRHQNMKAIWEATWVKLSEKKRETLAKFSVFRGGCSLEAAEEVTGTHFSVLLSLVNEALLKRIPPDRFEMHELLKQFASSKLTRSLAETQDKHALIYTNLAAENSALNSTTRLKTNFLATLENDLANLQVAWWHLIQQSNFKSLNILQSAFGYLFFTTARYKESVAFYQDSIQALGKLSSSSENRLFRSNLHSYLADSLMPLGAWDNAQTSLQQGLELLQEEKATVQRANLLESSARIYYFKGQFEHAKAAMLKANELVQETDNTQLKANTLHTLAIILKQLKDYDTAENYYHQALKSYQAIDDRHNIALTLDNLAALKIALGELATAQSLLKQALELSPNRRSDAVITFTLGATHYKLGNYPEAEQSFLSALKLAEEVNDNTLSTNLCLELAKTSIKLEQLEQARGYLLKSTELAKALKSRSQYLEIMLAYAQYLVALNKAEESLPYLKQVLEYQQDIQASCLQEAQQLKEQLPGAILEQLNQVSRQEELEPLIQELGQQLRFNLTP